ncbi:hypothetical protein WA1_02730 [Scytonema hofmannii PCC 7110]|uniref:Peptidase C14 caspase domain-containing protein n=1 Tax=Scytonema hofmannii PCC 7110 TaxID=128403 RepID=A0A139XH97_9CYAN|nr:caspase family protein [Scytonema hofmannii]KYC44075.1 hypothetical protein WA1_02730 [Scytonema hofmannii PCC 7110]
MIDWEAMRKLALLIGVSEYEPDLTSLPAARKDVEAVKQVLEHPDMGEFSEVRCLINPDTQEMQVAIETVFSNSTRDDLILLYFSGHGIKDESGRLYLATRRTRKNSQGELIRSTAVTASFVQENMSKSRSKRQVIVLDCCFSGAFAEGLLAKDDGSIDIRSQLGGEDLGREGRAVLTSSTSTQYSFENKSNLSIYTEYIVEGISTGAADLDGDSVISIDELHEYARRKVQEAAPAMKPEIYAVKQGYRIFLAKAPIGDPRLRYRKEVENCAIRGEISPTGRRMLDYVRETLGLETTETSVIEDEVLKPYREYNQNLQQYEQALVEAVQQEYPFSEYTLNELSRYQKILRLRNEDVAPIKERIAQQQQAIQLTGDSRSVKLTSGEDNHSALRSITLPIIPSVDSIVNLLRSRINYLLLAGSVVIGVLVVLVVTNYSRLPASNKVATKDVSLLYTLSEHSSPVSSVAITPNGQTLASGSHDKAIRLWNLSSGKTARSPLYGHKDPVLSIAISPNGHLLASGGLDNSIKLWDLSTKENNRTLEGHVGWVTAVAISSDGKILASGSSDNTIKLWEIATGTPIHTLFNQAPILAVTISPDNQILASSSTDKTVKLWDLSTGKLLRALEGHASWVDAIAISPNGQILASGSLDKTIKLWELGTGRLLRTLEGHKYSVSSIAISPDGQILISGGFDGEIRTWNLQKGSLIRAFKAHSAQVVSLAISKDEKILVSGSADSTIKTWHIKF